MDLETSSESSYGTLLAGLIICLGILIIVLVIIVGYHVRRRLRTMCGVEKKPHIDKPPSEDLGGLPLKGAEYVPLSFGCVTNADFGLSPSGVAFENRREPAHHPHTYLAQHMGEHEAGTG